MPRKLNVSYEWFLMNVDSSAGNNGCHLWTGPKHIKGYGQFGKNYLAHRWLLGYLQGEPLKTGELALHHCDVRLCVNPQHLYVGTAAQNSQDMVDRRRNPVVVANMTKTHCPQGHPYSGDNLVSKKGNRRECRACLREANRRYELRQKEAAA